MNVIHVPFPGPIQVPGGGDNTVGRPPLKKRNNLNCINISQAISISGNEPANDNSTARARRLEQNRRAAVESRRRKKVVLEELRRSMSFYTKANSNLKEQNQELERKIFIAKQHIANAQASVEKVVDSNADKPRSAFASKDMYQSMGFSPADAEEAMKTLSKLISFSADGTPLSLPPQFPPESSTDSECDDKEASEAYISALNEFAIQQVKAANAAAAAANAAWQVLSLHKRRNSAV
mmetsp:Transcript_34697/g.66547  ORF Transcript_34697/g.66547 Transcript_34697/m.66547 type:complete len:237 (-) Transcript_34697:204-914(-)